MLAAVTACALLIASPDWLFDRPGNIDAFKYVGLFLNFGRHLGEAEADYKISRLPWVLPGVAFYKIFPARIAHYVLQLAFTFGTLLFLYLSLKELFNREAALLSSLAYFGNSWYHGPEMWGSGGWNYHNTACLFYYFASLYLFASGARRKSSRLLIATGASLACCLFTTLFMAPFVVLLALVGAICFFPSDAPMRGRVKAMLSVAMGAVLATVFFAVVRVLTKGSFLFFATEWRYTFGISKQNIYFLPLDQYWKTAYWMMWPVLTAVAILALWLTFPAWKRQISRDRTVVGGFLQLQFLLTAGWFLLLSTRLRQSVLQFPQIVVPLAAPMLAAFAGCLFITQRNRKIAGGFFISAVAAGITLLVPWAITYEDKTILGTWLSHRFPIEHQPLAIPMVLVTAVVIFQWFAGRFRFSLIPTATLLSVFSALSFPYPSPLSRDAISSLNRDNFDAVIDANLFLTQSARTSSDNQVIYSYDEYIPASRGPELFLSPVFNSISASRFCPKQYDWAKREEWTPAVFESFGRVAILSSVPKADPFTQQLIAEGASRGVDLALLARRQIQRGDIKMTVSIVGKIQNPREHASAVGQNIYAGAAVPSPGGTGYQPKL